VPKADTAAKTEIEPASEDKKREPKTFISKTIIAANRFGPISVLNTFLAFAAQALTLS
jgi:hypothetical protein